MAIRLNRITGIAQRPLLAQQPASLNSNQSALWLI